MQADDHRARATVQTLVTSQDTRLVFVRFLFVGGALLITHMALATLFAVAFAIPPAIANVSAHLICIPPTYLAQRAFAFRSDAPHARAFVRYVLLQTPLMALGAGLAWLFVDQLGFAPAIAFIVICPFVALTSFVAQRWWAFARR